MTHPQLHGWTIQRIALESGTRWSTVQAFVDGRLISGWARYRIQQTLNFLGVKRG